MFQSRAQAASAPKPKALPAPASGNFFQRLYRTYWSDPVQGAKTVARLQNVGFFLGSVAAIKYFGQDFPFAAPTAAATDKV